MAILVSDSKKKPSKTDPQNEETCPFRRLIQQFLTYSRANGLADRTIEDYQDKVFKFWWWWSEHTHYAETVGRHPQNVKVEHAREYVSYLRTPLEHRWGVAVPKNKQKLSSYSVDSYGRALKVFFNWLVTEGHIDHTTPFNKTVRFSNRRKQDRKIKYLSTDEIARIFTALTEPLRLESYLGSRDLAIIGLLYDSGMRIGELLSIRVCDIDLKYNRCLVVGKTGQRTVVFSERCREFLVKYQRHPKHPNQQQDKIKDQQADTTSFWLTSDGFPLSFSGCQSLIRRVKQLSGVKFHAHLFRHNFATHMVAQNVNLFTIMELLGHHDISTTQVYVRQGNLERLAEVHKPNSPLNSLSFDQPVKKGRGRPRKWK